MNIARWLFVAVLFLSATFLWWRSASSHPTSTPRLAPTPPVSVEHPKGTTHEIQPPPISLVICPVARPETPEQLKKTFSDDARLAEAFAELKVLPTQPRDANIEVALRWYIFQPKINESLRNEAIKALLVWNPDWLVGDLTAMLSDPAQSRSWRAWCAQYLEAHAFRYGDDASLRGLEVAAQSNVPLVREQAIISMSMLARKLNWNSSDPARARALVSSLKELLNIGANQTASEKSSLLVPSTLESVVDAIAALELKELAPEIEQLAANESQNIGVRVAAVRALMVMGRTESLPCLEKCSKAEGQPTLVQVSMMAIQKLRKVE